MKAKAPDLYNLEEKAAVPQKQWFPSDTFSSQAATLTTIKNIKDMGTPGTGIEDIDSQNTLWQLTGFKFWSQLRVQRSEPRMKQGYGFQ